MSRQAAWADVRAATPFALFRGYKYTGISLLPCISFSLADCRPPCSARAPADSEDVYNTTWNAMQEADEDYYDEEDYEEYEYDEGTQVPRR